MSTENLEIPMKYTRWKHYSGRIYVVILITNLDSEKPEYPVTVCYEGNNGKVWSKPLTRFLETMKPLKNPGEKISKKAKPDITTEKILKYMYKLPNHSLRDLGEALGISKSGLVHRLKKLEDIGLVKNDYGRWILSELGKEKVKKDSLKVQS